MDCIMCYSLLQYSAMLKTVVIVSFRHTESLQGNVCTTLLDEEEYCWVRLCNGLTKIYRWPCKWEPHNCGTGIHKLQKLLTMIKRAIGRREQWSLNKKCFLDDVIWTFWIHSEAFVPMLTRIKYPEYPYGSYAWTKFQTKFWVDVEYFELFC